MKSLHYLIGTLLLLTASVCSAQWTREANYPAGATDAAIAFAIGDTIYFGGGSTGSTAFYKFDPATNTWTRKANIPQRAFGVSFAIGSKGYVALGQSDPQGNGQASVTNDLWEYDPASDHWTPKANLPGVARDAAFAFVSGGKAYVGGGTDAAYNFSTDFYCYDPGPGTWTTLGQLPDNFVFSAAFSIGNFGYVATGNDGSDVTSLWRYDAASDMWNQLSDFPGAARQAAVGFSVSGLGYVGLGQTQYSSVFKDLYSYDPVQDTWSPVTDFPGSNGRGWSVAAATSSEAFIGLGTYFTPSGLVGNSDLWKFSTSASVRPPSRATALTVFPNPVHESLAIQSAAPRATIEIRNGMGALCLSRRLPSDNRIDVSSLAPGVYEVEISSSLGHSFARIVKQ